MIFYLSMIFYYLSGYVNADFSHGSGQPIHNEKSEVLKPGNDREHKILETRLIGNQYYLNKYILLYSIQYLMIGVFVAALLILN